MTELTAPLTIVFTGILGGLAILQILLIVGRPLGRFAWGGQQDRLPSRLRIAAGLSIAIYAAIAAVALAHSHAVPMFLPSPVISVLTWVIAAYLVLSVLPNLASKSVYEKRVMTPVSALLAVIAIVIALT